MRRARSLSPFESSSESSSWDSSPSHDSNYDERYARHEQLLKHKYRYSAEFGRVKCFNASSTCKCNERGNRFCPSCGHMFYSRVLLHPCFACDSNHYLCYECQTGRYGTGHYSYVWYCSHCWAEWESSKQTADTVIQVEVTEIEESSRTDQVDWVQVSCFRALSGEKLLTAEVPRSGGLRTLRQSLRELLEGDADPKRIARNGFAYSKAEFKAYYNSFGPGVSEQRWEEAPQVWTTNVKLLLGVNVVPESEDNFELLAEHVHS